MKHRLLIDWLWWIPVVLYGFDMVPTKVELTGTITNIIDWTTEVTNFNLDYQAVGYSPFTTTNPNRTIVWTLTVLPIICSSDRNQGGNIPKAVLLASICSASPAVVESSKESKEYCICGSRTRTAWDADHPTAAARLRLRARESEGSEGL